MKTEFWRSGKEFLEKCGKRIKRLDEKTKWKICIVLLILLAYVGQGAIVYDTEKMIRFHVIAHNDSAEKQQEKLAIKDAVLMYLADDLKESKSVEESRIFLKNHITEIGRFVNVMLEQWGVEERAEVYYDKFPFPLKYYGAFSLPGGEYEALRIVIGEGQGENWWCVLYPQMCFSPASDMAYMEYEPEKKVIITWRLKEWWEKIKE